MPFLFGRGWAAALAPTYGVHPSTIWRDLNVILYRGRPCEYYRNGELLFIACREYPGGRVVSLKDPAGNEIRGQARRDILRRLPRYFGPRR